MSTATLDRPARTSPLTRRCEVLLRVSGQLGQRARRIECSEIPTPLCLSVCRCGHESRRWACEECATSPGTCRLCWDEGHACQVSVKPGRIL